jgi:hypothetical protein
VQLLNSGLWIFNKLGQVQGSPETLANFWFTLSPQPELTDTEVAYDPIAQRWLATTLSLPSSKNNGDLFFAFTQTSDATKGWNFYAIRGVCSGAEPTFPTPDQPILGYNQTWIAIALRCFAGGGAPPPGDDQLVLIPSTVLTASPAPASLGQTQKANAFFNARPSRDISGIANQPLFLVAPEVTASALPYVSVTSVDGNGNYVGPGPGNAVANSPGNGVMGTSGLFTLAEHDSCGPGASCEVSLQDDRITSAVVQTGNDDKHYLLTSFHAGDSTNSTVQALYFVGQIESFATGSQWNGWYIDGPGFWAGYPTITMDGDLDVAFTFSSFYLNSNIYPNWYLSKGFVPNDNNFALNPPLLGYGILGNASRGAYSGNTNCSPPGSPPQRWGDYMSTIWDSVLESPNEGSGFWTVQEYSNGGPIPTAGATPLGSNESTQFTALAEPLPYFVGYSIPIATPGGGVGEKECNGTSPCQLIYSAPPNAQFGDVFVADMTTGQDVNSAYAQLPPGWVAMPLTDHSNDSYLVSSGTPNNITIDYATSFLAAYVYGSQPNDLGQYTFGVTLKNSAAEVGGFLVSYRGASTNLPGTNPNVPSQYAANGDAAIAFGGDTDTSCLFRKKLNPPAATTLLYTFFGSCFVKNEEGESSPFSAPAGNPKIAPETPLSLTSWPYLAADTLVPSNGVSYGGYSTNVCTSNGGVDHAFALTIPE